MMEEKIEGILEESWKEFIKYYDFKADKYAHEYYNELISKPCTKKNPKKEVNDSHWICWNESDLMVQISRYFYDRLSQESDSKIEMHFDKNLNYSNFEGYSFDSILKNGDLEKELNKFTKPDAQHRKYPKLDLIITSEDVFGPFLLCAEAKCFHTNIMYGTVEEAIEKDIKTLSAIKKLGITQKIAYIIFDDYYYNHGQRDLKELVNNFSKTYGIVNELKILHHDSKRKLIV